jgi:two-component system, chemotaxis family, chemotaxis protein CheY
MKILIVEDDFTCRHLLQIYLADHGQVFVAINGKEALEAVRQAIKDKRPFDLICLDVMMPEMDGWETLKQIREIEEWNGISGLDCAKVIMTTARSKKEDIIKSFREGCEAYIVKPVRKPALLEQMSKLGLLAPAK